MNELGSSQSPKSESFSDSSFQNLRLSNNEFQELELTDPYASAQINNLDLLPDKTLTQSFRQTYKVGCSIIRTLKTNIAYKIRHSSFEYFSKREKIILNKDEPVVLLGKEYLNNSHDKQKFYLDFNNVIWLTYRTGIYGLETDAGWGCMIRVCQMVLAEAFKRLVPFSRLKEIVDYFRDTPEAYFSLIRICEKGQINQRWTSSIEIFSLLKHLLSNFQKITLGIDLHSSCIELQSLKELDDQKYPLMLFVSNRLGKAKLQIQYKEHILEMMKIPAFLGFIGGNGGEALYLIGHYCQKIIFMDPHYVQEFEEEEEGKNTSTYFQSEPYAIEFDCLSPSIAVTFLVKSKEEYYNLLVQLYKIQTKYFPWVSLEVSSDELRKKLDAQIIEEEQDQFVQMIP